MPEYRKTQTTSGFFGEISISLKHLGSGDVTRTHDTPGMNACGDGVQ